MKQKLLLALLALFTLGGSNLQAQLENGTVYWIQDASTGQFISQGDNWSTRAVAQNVGGLGFEAVYVSDGVYKLNHVMWNTVRNTTVGLGVDVYVDQTPVEWTITASGDGYTIKNGDNYLVNNGQENSYKEKPINKTTDASKATVWKFLTRTEYDAAIQAYKNGNATSYATNMGYNDVASVETLETLIGDADKFISKDYTNSITNPTLGSNWDGWTHGAISQRGEGAGVGSGCAEFWNGCGYAKQTVSGLPTGLFKVTFVSAYRPGNGNITLESEKASSPAFVYANDAEIEFLHWVDVPAKANGRSSITTANGYGQSFYTYVSDGTLALGVVADGWMGDNGYIWQPFGQFTLTYYTDKVTDAEIDALVNTIPTNIPTVIKNNINTLKEALQSTKTIADYNALSAAIEAAAPIAEKYDVYGKVKARMLTIKDATGYADEQGSATTTFDDAINSQDAAVEQATDIDAIQACINAVRSAAGSFLGNVSVTSSVDATALIMNDTPTSNGDFWTLTGNAGFDANNNVAEYWNQSGVSIKQTLKALPKGYYTLTAVALARPDQEGVLSANENRVNLVQNFEQPSGNTTEGGNWFDEGNGVNTLSFSLDEAKDVEIGITADVNNGDHWTLWRNFKLTYFGLDPLAAQETLYQEALAYANSVNEAEENAIVTGDEATALDEALANYGNVVANYEDVEASKAELETAAATLNAAAKAVVDAVPSYQAYNAERAKAEIIGLTSQEIPSATNAATAAAAVNQMKIAESTFVNTNYPAEVTELVGDLSTWKGSTGTGTSNDQHWSGQTKTYYEQGGSNWGANAWEISYTKAVTLPAGKYMAKVAARGSAGLTYTKLSISATNNEMPLAHKGDSGKGITTDGTTSFDEGTFANSNNGRGWEWGYLPFELTEPTEVAFTLASKAEANRMWVSYCDFALLNVAATEEDYAALEAAKPENIVLGFEEGEYAPYNNIDAAAALDLANEIDTEAQNAQIVVKAAIVALTAAAWTANTEEVDAIFDGQFATTEPLSESGKVVLPGWTKVDGIRLLVKDETTDPGLAYTDGKAAVFSWGGTTLTYGEQEGYTLPMNKNSIYELTFKIAGWRDGDLPNNVSVELDGVSQNVEPTVGRINVSGSNPFATLTFYVTPTTDNSILKISGNKHFAIADLSMKLANTVVIDEANKYDPAKLNGSAKQVTFKRTLVEGWNGLVLPFDMTVNEAKTVFNASAVKDFTGVTYDETKGATLVFSDATDITAGKPFMIKATAGTEYTINNVELKADELQTIEQTVDEVKYTMTGTYQKVDLTNVNFVLIQGNNYYQHNTNKQSSAKAFRAYFVNESTGEAASKGINFDFGDETNGISLIEDAQNSKNGNIYNLQGQKVNHAQKGVYIVNGKKIVVK